METAKYTLPCILTSGVLGSILIDIRLKLHLVHFAVKFSSASAVPYAVSTQFGLSPFSSRPFIAVIYSADLKMDLGGLQRESVKSPSLHSEISILRLSLGRVRSLPLNFTKASPQLHPFRFFEPQSLTNSGKALGLLSC